MKVSALVSAYYCEEYLEERLKNLWRLDPAPEIVLACQRGSLEAKIAESWEGRKNYIAITTYDVPTWGAAINLCIGRATGEYLTTANADDLFYPQGLNVMSSYLDAHAECGIVHGGLDVREPDGTIHYWHRPGDSISFHFCRVGPFPLWRRALHDQFGYFDEQMTVCADYDFWLRCWSQGIQVQRISQTVGLFQRRKDNIAGKHPGVQLREDAEIRHRYASRPEPAY